MLLCIRFPLLSNNLTSAATPVPSVLVSTSPIHTPNPATGSLNSNNTPFLLVVDHADSSFQNNESLSENGLGAVSCSEPASLMLGNDVSCINPRRSVQVMFLRLIVV